MMLRRGIIHALEALCTALDNIPWRDGGDWYRRGDRGCIWGVCLYAVKLDDRWGTGVWTEV